MPARRAAWIGGAAVVLLTIVVDFGFVLSRRIPEKPS
jgi:hypothetical protein